MQHHPDIFCNMTRVIRCHITDICARAYRHIPQMSPNLFIESRRLLLIREFMIWYSREVMMMVFFSVSFSNHILTICYICTNGLPLLLHSSNIYINNLRCCVILYYILVQCILYPFMFCGLCLEAAAAPDCVSTNIERQLIVLPQHKRRKKHQNEASDFSPFNCKSMYNMCVIYGLRAT